MKQDESEKPVRRVWPIVMMVAGVACSALVLVSYILSLKAKTTIDAFFWKYVTRDCPFAQIGMALSIIAVYMVAKRSKLFWAGMSSFVLSLLVSALLTELYVGAICSTAALILGLLNIPKALNWRVYIALFSTIIGMVSVHQYDYMPMYWRGYTQGNLRSLAFAVENYRNEHHAFPLSTTDSSMRLKWKSESGLPCFGAYREGGPYGLTTPVGYIQSLPKDVYRHVDEERSYAYHCWGDDAYILISAGRNCVFDIKPEELSAMKPGANWGLPTKLIDYQYDPTNGGTSAGDIYLVGPKPQSKE
ncbi:hypothetical protein LLG95_03545 [bacterium]|nr:hypothetical protein [bacterium]